MHVDDRSPPKVSFSASLEPSFDPCLVLLPLAPRYLFSISIQTNLLHAADFIANLTSLQDALHGQVHGHGQVFGQVPRYPGCLGALVSGLGRTLRLPVLATLAIWTLEYC